MLVGILESDRRLAEFERRNSPPGLLRSYARGRLKHFLVRQVLMVVVTALLINLVSPLAGFAAALLVLTGEAIDCLFLLSIEALLAKGTPLRRLVLFSTVTATLQAASIAFGVVLAWHMSPGQVASGFAMAFLMAAVINAGMVLPYNRPATIARFGVYGLTGIALILDAILLQPGLHPKAAADLAAMTVMAYPSYLFIHHIVQTLHTRQRKNHELLVYSRDLAQANRDLEARQKEARRLSLVAKHANDSVIITDAQRRILWVNDAFTRLSGYTLDEIRGHDPSDFTNTPETSAKASQEIASAISEGRPLRTQILNQAKDGRHFWVGTNIVPLLDDAGNVDVVIAIERDITDIKKHEAELARAMAASEAAAEAKARFLATMSHEIRTPMNGIIGMADLLADAGLSPENRQYVNTIRRSGEALLTIINDVLDFSKLQSGTPTLHSVAFDPKGLLDDAITLLSQEARKKQLTVDVTTQGDLPKKVLGDDGRLRQILVNIIGNAIKFTETGGISVTLSCETGSVAHALGLTITVRDSGIGIPADRLDQVFDEFAQSDSATTRQFGGTGLGLPISRLLAREMGGDITAQSTPGKGSTFTIKVTLATIAPDCADTPNDSHALAGKVVLVAEDNQTNRLLLRKYLKDQQITLLFARNGIEAVEMVRTHTPDIVLMDMSMPEMDGLTATRQIRATPDPQPQIIALTANAFASDKAACLDAGMDGFLSKPLRKPVLLHVLAARARAAGTFSRRNPPPPSTATTPPL